MRSGTLTTDFKNMYIKIYIQLIYVINICVYPRKSRSLLWLCGCQWDKIPVVALLRKTHCIFEHLLRQLYLLQQFLVSITSDTTEAFSK